MAKARIGWYSSRTEYNRRVNGYEAVIVKTEDGQRRLLMFSIYDSTRDIVDETFPTVKAAKAYADEHFANTSDLIARTNSEADNG